MGKDCSLLEGGKGSGGDRLSRSLGFALVIACCLVPLAPGLDAQTDDTTAGSQVQSSPSRPVPPASGQYKLSGSVANAVTGEPIGRALVQLQGEFERSMLTDANGHFEFVQLPAAHVIVTARKPGFFSDEELDSGRGQTSAISVGPDSEAVVVKLTPESIIFGRVEAPDGEPIEDIPIRVISSRVIDGRKRWEPRANGMTNEDGEFRVANLPPGIYYVEAGPGASFRVRRARRLKLGEEGYTTAFYPGAADPTGATPILLSPGQQQEVQFSLKPQPVFKLSGIIKGYQAEMGMDLQFVDRIGEQLAVPTQFDPQTGRFSTKLPAGDYTLRARAQDARQLAAADLPLSVTSDLTGIQVVLGPGMSIPVVVRRESSANDPENAQYRAGGPPVALHLFSSESPLSALDFWSAPDPQAGHPIAVRNVEPGKYFVEVSTGGAWYVQAMTCGSVDLLREALTVPSGAQLPPIEVVLRDDGATLSGAVQSEGGPEKGVAVLVPDHGSAAQAKVASAGQSGSFRFDHLAPGDYRVLAFDRIGDLEYRDPETLNAYLSGGTHVSLQANGQASTTVELIKVEK
jgi:hypothetical protein